MPLNNVPPAPRTPLSNAVLLDCRRSASRRSLRDMCFKGWPRHDSRRTAMRSVALRPLPPRLGNQVQGLVVFGQFAGNAVNPFGAESQHSVTGRNMLGRSSFPLRVRLPGQKSQKETQLRNLLLGGTVGVAFTL